MSAEGAQFKQDAAPPGGYPSVRIEPRNFPRWRGRSILAVATLVTCVSLKVQLEHLKHRRTITQNKYQERWDLIPFIMAENDRVWLNTVGPEAAETHWGLYQSTRQSDWTK